MMFNNPLLVFTFTLFSIITPTFGAVISTAADLNSTSLPYPVVPSVFSGVIDGHAYEIEGSIEEVSAKLTALYPTANLTVTPPSDDEVHALATRAKAALECNNRPDWSEAEWYQTERGVNQVLSRGGTVAIPARSCVKLWCAIRPGNDFRGDAIYACNDNTYRIDPNTHYLGTYADTILRVCYHIYSVFGTLRVRKTTKGQFFDTDRYNVIIRATDPGTDCR